MLCFLNSVLSAHRLTHNGVHTESTGGGGPGHIHQNNTVVPNTKTITPPWAKIQGQLQIRNTLTKCIEKSASKSLDLNGRLTNESRQGDDVRGNKHNLSMYIQTTVEHYYYIVLLLFFLLRQAHVGWYVCAEVTLLQRRMLPSSLVFQSQQLLLTVNG